MIFNSVTFIYFFIIVYCIYLILHKSKRGHYYQNSFLLFASYFFYGWWNWTLLCLILFSTMMDFWIGITLEKLESKKYKKLFLLFSLLANFGLLITFKYFNFFTSSFLEVSSEVYNLTNFDFFKINPDGIFINLILPVGISFYTLQSISYIIDVYNQNQKAEKSFLSFALYVCFFPQLVAGPIEKAQKLLPQIHSKRMITYEQIQKGFWLILLGYFMKVYVSDNLDTYVDQIYDKNSILLLAGSISKKEIYGLQILLSCIAVMFQVYCDFAGYSNIARGVAYLMGFELSQNFIYPEFSRNPMQFWNQWHITLNAWFRDYLYFPLGGSRKGKLSQYKNLFLVFFLSGLWHGANWTYISWGTLNGLYLIGYLILKQNQIIVKVSDYLESKSRIRSIYIFFQYFLTYFLVIISGIFFRSIDIYQSFNLLSNLFLHWGGWNGIALSLKYFSNILTIILPIVILDFVYFKTREEFWIFKIPVWSQLIITLILFYICVLSGIMGKEVIYFAF